MKDEETGSSSKKKVQLWRDVLFRQINVQTLKQLSFNSNVLKGVAILSLVFKASNLSHSSHCGTSQHKKHRPKGFSLNKFEARTKLPPFWRQSHTMNEQTLCTKSKPSFFLFFSSHSTIITCKPYTVALLITNFTQFSLFSSFFPSKFGFKRRLKAVITSKAALFSRAHKSHKSDSSS